MREREREREREFAFSKSFSRPFSYQFSLKLQNVRIYAVCLLLIFLVLNDKIHSIVSIHSVVTTFIQQCYKVTNGEFKGQISKMDIHIM